MTTEKKNLEDTLKNTVEPALEVARLWARHGLQIGKLALETSAKTLQLTAQALNDVSEKLDREPKTEPKAPEAQPS